MMSKIPIDAYPRSFCLEQSELHQKASYNNVLDRGYDIVTPKKSVKFDFDSTDITRIHEKNAQSLIYKQCEASA